MAQIDLSRTVSLYGIADLLLVLFAHLPREAPISRDRMLRHHARSIFGVEALSLD